MNLCDFDYFLPNDLIARYPLPERSASRLLCLNGQTGALQHRQFRDILDLLQPGDIMVGNNSRVIPARLYGVKATGGQVEVMVERILDDQRLLALVRASKSPKIGSTLHFGADITFTVHARHNDLFELQLTGARTVMQVLEHIGQLPLPPYLQREPEAIDQERYQTVYAEPKGSVAAPTAGLHFDETMLQAIKARGVDMVYVTLHVGAGTFAPVRVENITEHRMHAESVTVSAEVVAKIKAAKAKGGRVIAIGTTSARSLETASLSGTLQPFAGDTDIFIYPGFSFNCVDVLLTNLHLPGSTLLMLVSALGGYTHIMQAYQTAVQEKYRFFSYGDAMWIERAPAGKFAPARITR